MNPNASRSAAAAEFQHARQVARWHHIRRMFAAKSVQLCQFSLDDQPITQHLNRGIQTIEIDKVVGSVGRSQDFDADFLPRVDYVQERWIGILLAYQQGEYLPPVDVYKVGDFYYVIDGHHRLSVMRYHGQRFVEASVIEVQTPCWN